MTKIKPRPPQSRVKHLILEKYLTSWGSIIINGLKDRRSHLHLVYIDCHASYGRYAGELKDTALQQEPPPVFGSSIIGVATLDELARWAKERYGLTIQTNAILIEKEPKIFAELKQSLALAGFAQRIKEVETFSCLTNGDIAALCTDSTCMASELVRYTQSRAIFSLFLLDPYGPTGIPLNFVREIIRQPRHDVIINMPYQDLHKKSGIATKVHLAPTEKELIKHYDAMFGNERWQSIARALDPNAIWEEEEALEPSEFTIREADEARSLEQELMNCYKESLQSVDPALTVKSMKLRFPDRERTMYYLYLTTHDPSGALQMNKVLWDAWQQEHELRWDLMQSKKHAFQPPLIETSAPPLETPQRALPKEIALQIVNLFGRKTITRKEIYRAMANESYFVDEIEKALTVLKREKRAVFGSQQGINTQITILGH